MPELEFHPVVPDRWDDLAAFFSRNGNPNYCWCMRWRLRSREFDQLKSTERRECLKGLIKEGVPVGVLGYADGVPAAWCSIAPRETYPLLEHSTTLLRLDDEPVWSVVCFFVDRTLRQQGATCQLLQSAIEYAQSQGARIVEGYPVDPLQSYRNMGTPGIFERAGFFQAGLAKNGRSVVRQFLYEGK